MLSHRLLRSVQRTSLTRAYASGKHTSDTYNKEVDTTPPASKVFRVDADSEAAHSPEEPIPSPTETTSKEYPYLPKGEHGEKQDHRYGGLGSYEPDKTQKGGGPDSTNAGGRHPEKR